MKFEKVKVEEVDSLNISKLESRKVDERFKILWLKNVKVEKVQRVKS